MPDPKQNKFLSKKCNPCKRKFSTFTCLSRWQGDEASEYTSDFVNCCYKKGLTQTSTSMWKKNRTNSQKVSKTKSSLDENKSNNPKMFINTERYLNGLCSKIMDKQKFMREYNMIINFDVRTDESLKIKNRSENIDNKISEKNVSTFDESIKDIETNSLFQKRKPIKIDRAQTTNVAWMLSSYQKLVPLTKEQFPRTTDGYSFQGEDQVMWIYKDSNNFIYPRVVKFNEIVDQKICSAEKEPSKHVQELTELLHKSFKLNEGFTNYMKNEIISALENRAFQSFSHKNKETFSTISCFIDDTTKTKQETVLNPILNESNPGKQMISYNSDPLYNSQLKYSGKDDRQKLFPEIKPSFDYQTTKEKFQNFPTLPSFKMITAESVVGNKKFETAVPNLQPISKTEVKDLKVTYLPKQTSNKEEMKSSIKKAKACSAHDKLKNMIESKSVNQNHILNNKTERYSKDHSNQHQRIDCKASISKIRWHASTGSLYVNKTKILFKECKSLSSVNRSFTKTIYPNSSQKPSYGSIIYLKKFKDLKTSN